MTLTTSNRMRNTGRGLTAVGAGLLALAVCAAPAAAGGNPNFNGILSATAPTGFVSSPSSIDISSGPATVTFSIKVSNLTSSAQKVALNFSADHILTYNGANVSDGQPGKAGITFNGPAGTTQAEAPGRQSFTLSLAASEKNHALTLTRTMSACGYYQLDVWGKATGQGASRDRATLASGFIRVLGCTQSVVTTPTPSIPNTGQGAGVPSTGADLLGPGAGGLALVTIGIGFVVAAARRRGAGVRIP